MDEEIRNENVNENLHAEERVDADGGTEPSSEETEVSDANDAPQIDYETVIAEDLKILRSEFSELANLTDIMNLENPLRYAALRDMGLTPEEAYLATTKRKKSDNRSHLYATRPISSSSQGAISESEMALAREIFSDISDAQIRNLYKRVTV